MLGDEPYSIRICEMTSKEQLSEIEQFPKDTMITPDQLDQKGCLKVYL